MQHIYLGSYIVPYPYVLFLLLLPFEVPKIASLFIALLLGVVIDLFCNSSGLHTSSALVAIFSRYYILKYVSPRDGYDAAVQPNVYDMGLQWFITYAGSIIFIHHTYFFYLEAFRFTEFFSVLLRVILSSVSTFLVCYLLQFLFYKNQYK